MYTTAICRPSLRSIGKEHPQSLQYRSAGHALGRDVGTDKTVYLMTYWHVDRHFSN
jgi:hypothetical protein